VLAAFYVTSKTLDLSELRTHCKKYLSEYMIPVHFMELEELPLTINGKVDRKAIADIEIVSQVVEENQALPETEIEKKVALIWQEVLGITSIAIDDNFFEIGGHSLHAIKILTLVNKEFKIALTMKKVLSLVTIKEFAGYINFLITQREMKLNQDELTEIEL
jgi:acyl carrier protein